MRETTANEIERINVIILVLGSLASLAVMRDFQHFFSFVAGSSIMTLNFRYLRRIMEAFFSKASSIHEGDSASSVHEGDRATVRSAPSKAELFIRLPIKFFVLVALVVVVLLWGNVDIVFFIIGLSTVLLSIIISQVAAAFGPGVRRKEDGT
jgi:hypothetical protein